MNSVLLSSSGTPDIAPNQIGEWLGFRITETILSCAITVLVLIALAVLVRVFLIPRWRRDLKRASGLQAFLEWIVDFVDGNAHSMTGHNANFTGFWFFVVFLLIFCSTMIEVFALRPPTSDLNFTFALGLSTYFLIQIFGIKDKRYRRLDRYLPRILPAKFGVAHHLVRLPNPINIVTDSVIPFSMALRMFGSVFSGFLIVHLLYGLFPIGLPVVGYIAFTMFHAVIQGYVFMMLSCNFIAEATE